jgi:hypothetical protein
MLTSISSLLSHRWPTFVAAAVWLALLVSPELAQAQFTQQGQKLVGTGAVGNAYQGFSVALSADSNTAIVGGPDDNSSNNTPVGAAWVYTRSGGVWTQQGNKLVGTDAVGVGGPAQGSSVALSADGNTAIVGGPDDNGSTGAVWVYTRSGGVWTQQACRSRLLRRAVRRWQHRPRGRGWRQWIYGGSVGLHSQRRRLDPARRQAGWGGRGWSRRPRLFRCALLRRQHRSRGRA